jgi:cobalt-zinc-cadmium efflux system membrane fusion protein
MKKQRPIQIILFPLFLFCLSLPALSLGEDSHDSHKHDSEVISHSKDHGDEDGDKHHDEGHDEGHGDLHSSHDETNNENNLSGHDHHGAVSIKKEDLGLFEVELTKVISGEIRKFINVVGEVSLNRDHITHIVPRATGIVKSVYKNIGENVKKGDLLASLESIELADAKSRYLSEQERMTVKKEIFELVEKLKKQGVSFSKEYLGAKSEYAEANIQFKNARQKLLTYGLKERDIEKISKENIEQFMRFDVVSPVDGIVLEKHISIGEFVKDDKDTMTIANLDNVWINLNVFQDDVPFIKEGTIVDITSRNSKSTHQYRVAYSAPVVNETTRTALARVVAKNTDNIWRPGEFIQGRVEKSKKAKKLIRKLYQNLPSKQLKVKKSFLLKIANMQEHFFLKKSFWETVTKYIMK